MNNFLVPIDFSETSRNAARYAAHISTLVPDAHLILYNVFDSLEYGSDSSPLGTEGEEDASRKAIMELALESVRTEISPITRARISLVAEENHRFLDTLEKIHRTDYSEVQFAGNYFSVVLSMDIEFKKHGIRSLDEICIYQVENEKIIFEQFFRNL